MMTFDDLQTQHAAWATANFGSSPSYRSLLGAGEEIGELYRAHLKAEQGIRGTPEEHRAAKIDAVADTIIFLADYCTRENIDLQQAVEETWAKVRIRNWKANPQTGAANE